MNADGTCPGCGRVVEAPEAKPTKRVLPSEIDVNELAGEDAKAPWHFKLLMVLLALYLGWRVVDLFS
jgi:hypothetical protein